MFETYCTNSCYLSLFKYGLWKYYVCIQALIYIPNININLKKK